LAELYRAIEGIETNVSTYAIPAAREILLCEDASAVFMRLQSPLDR
jgi:hypothetical protein